jgi:RNA polymerase sigma-70 factor (ECF subfamily)
VHPKEGMVRVISVGLKQTIREGMNTIKLFAGLTYEDAVRKYADTVTRVCVMRCGNAEDARDCFQNVFLKLYLSTTEFETEEHVKAWLLKVAVHQCQDMVKQFWKKNVTLSGDDKDTDLGLSTVAITDEQDSEVLRQVMSLPLKYRQVIYMYYYEEYDIQEVAKILGLREATVKSQLRRGREYLKRKLGGIGIEEAM